MLAKQGRMTISGRRESINKVQSESARQIQVKQIAWVGVWLYVKGVGGRGEEQQCPEM